MADVIKNALYRQIRTFNKSFSKVKSLLKTWHCKSIAKSIREQKLESSLVKSLSKKLDKFGWTLVVDVAGLDHAVIVQFSGVARGLGIPPCVTRGVTHWKHWFWIKLAIITFVATSTAGVDSSAICTSWLLFFCVWNFVPFWCCCGAARRAFHFAR